MQLLNYFDDVPPCIWDIKQKIVDIEQLSQYEQEPMFKDAIGYMVDGGALHLHKDSNPSESNLIHVRYNVYVQIPHEGGIPVYDGVECGLRERSYICCRSGIDPHYCTTVHGLRERVVLSFGFLMPSERISHITYAY